MLGIVSNLEIISKYQENVRLYASTMLFYIRDLVPEDPGHLQGFLTNPCIFKGQLYI